MKFNTCSQTTNGFYKFPVLPTEIQLKIWQLAVPDPRLITSVIIMIINLDLNRPRAFVPSTRGLRQSQTLVEPERYLDNEQQAEWDEEFSITFDSRQQIYSIMHSSQQSRKVARKIYRLELPSIIPEENVPLWSSGPEDIVYFQCTEMNLHLDAMLHYLTLDRTTLLIGFDSLRHVAFCVTPNILAAINYFEPMGPWRNYDGDESPWEFELLQNFPAMETLSLFLDPSHIHREWTTGKIALYPPQSETRIAITNKTAEHTEHAIEKILKPRDGSRDTLVVDVFVMLRRRHKRGRN